MDSTGGERGIWTIIANQRERNNGLSRYGGSRWRLRMSSATVEPHEKTVGCCAWALLLSYECLNMPKENMICDCYHFYYDILLQSLNINNLYHSQLDSVTVPCFSPLVCRWSRWCQQLPYNNPKMERDHAGNNTDKKCTIRETKLPLAGRLHIDIARLVRTCIRYEAAACFAWAVELLLYK